MGLPDTDADKTVYPSIGFSASVSLLALLAIKEALAGEMIFKKKDLPSFRRIAVFP